MLRIFVVFSFMQSKYKFECGSLFSFINFDFDKLCRIIVPGDTDCLSFDVQTVSRIRDNNLIQSGPWSNCQYACIENAHTRYCP